MFSGSWARAYLVGAAAIALLSLRVHTQTSPAGPRAELATAPLVRLSGGVDSNSPALWQLVRGRWQFHVLTSIDGAPSYAVGANVNALGLARRVALEPWPGDGVWMEAVVADEDDTWYGFYHNERVAEICGSRTKVIPRIGAARSFDRGVTWENLGIVLEAPPGSHVWDTTNKYFVGGIGDLSIMLDPGSRDLYLYYSQYVQTARLQGIGIARIAWADRDAPVGKVTVWRGRMWQAARAVARDSEDREMWTYPAAVTIFPPAETWHDLNTRVDAFWGPSVHWNTHLQQYVMLLNRSKDEEFRQEGIYVSFSPRIDDPRLWSVPVKILNGGEWYPQVIGLEAETGTDKMAGEIARFFMAGSSRHYIRFIR